MPDKPSITILMATYNGASHLREQVASIQAQTLGDWRLLIRDDGSSDATPELLRGFEASDPRIRILRSGNPGGGGAVGNFSALIDEGLRGEGEIFFFCDQDDTWDPAKLERQSRAFEQGGEEDLPLLVHSDLAVVDEEGRLIDGSLVDYMALQAEPEPALDYLLSRNFVTGCAMAANRALLTRAAPLPSAAIMHDWWLALVAAASGGIRFLDEALVNYRQHGQNVLGARSFLSFLNPANDFVAVWRVGNREFHATFAQAMALEKKVEATDGWLSGSAEKIALYAGLGRLPRTGRLAGARKLKLRQGNLLLQAVFYLRLLTLSSPDPVSDRAGL